MKQMNEIIYYKFATNWKKKKKKTEKKATK
jgi:hypothetical protein